MARIAVLRGFSAARKGRKGGKRKAHKARKHHTRKSSGRAHTKNANKFKAAANSCKNPRNWSAASKKLASTNVLKAVGQCIKEKM